MTKVLFIQGDGDYDAVRIERLIGYEEAAKRTADAGGGLVIDWEEDEVYAELSIREFSDVDPNFVTFIRNHFVDYDVAKAKDFYVINTKEGAE